MNRHYCKVQTVVFQPWKTVFMATSFFHFFVQYFRKYPQSWKFFLVELSLAWKIVEMWHILLIPSPYYICQCFNSIQVTYMTLDSKWLFPWILNGSTWWLPFLQVFVSELSSWYPCWIAHVIHSSTCWFICWALFNINCQKAGIPQKNSLISKSEWSRLPIQWKHVCMLNILACAGI